MKPVSFNEGWTCRHLEDAGPGEPVTIPHDAMISEPRTEQSAGGVNTGWFEGHDYLYTKMFTPDEKYAGKKAILEFEGVYHNAEVYLNGDGLTFRPYGYTDFAVDLSDHWIIGEENKLEVIARNADQPNSRWYSGAGIYRPVVLWVSDPVHILRNGVKIRTLSLEPCEIEVRVRTEGTGGVNVSILDGDRQIAAGSGSSDGEACLRIRLDGAEPWSPEHPRLYTCRVTFGTDEAEETFGVRTLEWGSSGLKLNGQRIILRGACIHHDNGVLGARCLEDAERRRIRLLKENGYNAVRSAHNPCSKALLKACDSLGVLVMDEYVDHWYIHKTEHDYASYFADWWKQDLKDMVEKDYNHPSVILYSTGNEVSETAQEKGIRLTGELTEYLHSLDGTRPVTCGVNIVFNFLSSIGLGVYSDGKAEKDARKAAKTRKAARAEEARESGETGDNGKAGDGERPGNTGKPAAERAVGSRYFNSLAEVFGAKLMKAGAALPACDRLTKGAFANMDIAGYNYGISRYRHDLKEYPDRLILGSETFCSDAYRFWEIAKDNPRIIGDFVWAGMDYLGEVGVGAWEYKDYAPDFSHGVGWLTAGSGRIDLTGKPLGEALYTKVAFDLEKGPLIAVRPVSHTGERHSPSAWKMTDAMPSWSWEGCEGQAADVEVYARAYSAELRVNGKSVGKKYFGKDCRVKFRCLYENGTVEAVSYDRSGAEIGRSSLHTASGETELRAVPESGTVKPGHLCFIRLQYTDGAGIVKPLERGILDVTVTGGKLLGLGSACPYNPIGFCTNRTDTYYGEALAVVQPDEDSDCVMLSATDGKAIGSAAVPVVAEGNN
ncbi:MAG: glycoside hydrolase family 2 TIM barrel-domain containing protein [Lachnospiraceae bacterium]|jgi:beta-galactosidase